MKIADLDAETLAVIVLAHIVAERPTADNLARLRRTLEKYDTKHADEREENLIKAIFGGKTKHV